MKKDIRTLMEAVDDFTDEFPVWKPPSAKTANDNLRQPEDLMKDITYDDWVAAVFQEWPHAQFDLDTPQSAFAIDHDSSAPIGSWDANSPNETYQNGLGTATMRRLLASQDERGSDEELFPDRGEGKTVQDMKPDWPNKPERSNKVNEAPQDVTEEDIRELENLQEQLHSIIRDIEMIMRGTTEEGRAKAYWLAQLKIASNADHSYMTHDAHMGQAIDSLRDQIGGEDGYDDFEDGYSNNMPPDIDASDRGR